MTRRMQLRVKTYFCANLAVADSFDTLLFLAGGRMIESAGRHLMRELVTQLNTFSFTQTNFLET